ncbi:M17 family metallopeptidase [Maritalea porphyrae]|jgi:leucyl aminopeptidase|uniref:leucyl aminopeptidase family protein n=1 Tax=Maritalea porphyrae TaxID=880732 RepID=UPI0022AFBB46|nr:leucyl aminopeptidase family protein [Maritalea porphyrae]MCZ4271719.1 leucyl aminopeptidase family protein [Maritalea porphyrae]
MTKTITCVWQGDQSQLAKLNENQTNWLKASKFEGRAGELVAVPTATGEIDQYVFGMGEREKSHPMVTGLAASQLKDGEFDLRGEFDNPDIAALGFRLGGYQFTNFKKSETKVSLGDVEGADKNEVALMAEAAELARDLINRPANDLGPENYEATIREFAQKHGANVRSIVGDDLLKQNFPMIHTVGRASAQAPRLLDFTWGAEDAPKVTLVGKGVIFDSGGLDIKPAAGMLLMKKDMGGSANVLGLAHAIMSAKLNVRLRVLIPVVENAISGNAFRPGDVLPSRNGMTVEIGNTDAEGRLVLADALSLADEESPEIVIDMATLTGAARVAVGTELAALFSNDDAFANEIMAEGIPASDPLWRLPLWDNYDELLASPIADVNHVSLGGYGGAITAALFLRRFIKNTKSWSHMDMMAWADKPRPGRPLGGTEQGQRAAYLALKKRFG